MTKIRIPVGSDIFTISDTKLKHKSAKTRLQRTKDKIMNIFRENTPSCNDLVVN